MAEAEDTNLAVRGGLEGQRWAREQAGKLLRETPAPSRQAVEALDQAFIRRNLSPGGCADLLTLSFFFYFLEEGDRPGETFPCAQGASFPS